MTPWKPAAHFIDIDGDGQMSRVEFDAAYGIQDPEAICLRFGLGFRAKGLGSRTKPNPTNLQNKVRRLVPYLATKAIEEAIGKETNKVIARQYPNVSYCYYCERAD